jgi:hypothetical protein
MTKGDQIRQMSNEELADAIIKTRGRILFCDFCGYHGTSNCKQGACKEGIKAYLDMEVE